MRIIVLKFGGTSIGNIERIRKLPSKITKKKNWCYCSVISNEWRNKRFNRKIKTFKKFDLKEYDVLVSSESKYLVLLFQGIWKNWV